MAESHYFELHLKTNLENTEFLYILKHWLIRNPHARVYKCAKFITAQWLNWMTWWSNQMTSLNKDWLKPYQFVCFWELVHPTDPVASMPPLFVFQSKEGLLKPGWRNGNLKSQGKKWANLGSLFNLLKEQLHLRFLLPSANDDKTVKEKDKYVLEMEHSCFKGCAWKACINNSNMSVVHSADHYYIQHLTILSLLLFPENT